MRDDIARLTEQLIHDPASLSFVPLVDALRRARRLDEARRVALTGLERHPYNADAHDALARVYADSGDSQRARDEWGMALHVAPQHTASLRGLGFLAYRDGDIAGAERYLERALALSPNDDPLKVALRRVRHAGGAHTNGNGNGHAAPRPTSLPAKAPARDLFAPLLDDGVRTALLLDRDGLVLAGTYLDASGRDVGDEIGAEWSGVSDEAERALAQLGLGKWTALVIEAHDATLALSPAPEGGIVLVAAERDTQVGLVRRLLTQAAARAASWLGVPA